MKKRRGLLDDGKPETPQLTQGKLEELRLSVAHMLLADLGTIKPDADPGCEVRNGGRFSLASGFTRRSIRRSVMLIKSVSAIAA